MKCKKCGLDTSEKTNYCENCGFDLRNEFCPKCKTECSGNFCSNCGHHFSESSVYVAPAKPQPHSPPVHNVIVRQQSSGLCCPRCRSHDISVSTYAEPKKSGCGTILLYVILALTIFGLLIVIPLMLRNGKSHQVTVCVCKNCGNKWRI